MPIPVRRRRPRRDRRRRGEASGRGVAGDAGHGTADPSRTRGARSSRRSAAARCSSRAGSRVFSDRRELRRRRSRDQAAARRGRAARRRACDPRGGGRRPARLQRRDDELRARADDGEARRRHGGRPPVRPVRDRGVRRAGARTASSQARQVPVKEALLVQYAGVYAPPPSVAVLGKANAERRCEQLAYRVTQPSTVTANVVAPDGDRPQSTPAARQPGTYSFTWDGLRHRGNLALERAGDRRPEPAVDRRPDVRRTTSRSRASRCRSGVRGGLRSASRSRGPPRPFCRSPPRTAPSSSPSRRQASHAGAQSLAWDGLTSAGREGAAGRVRRHRHRDERDRHRLVLESLRARRASSLPP